MARGRLAPRTQRQDLLLIHSQAGGAHTHK
jgi:hypothetical protein